MCIRDRDGGEDAGDDRQRLGGVDVAGQFLRCARLCGPDFEQGNRHGAAQQLSLIHI